MIRRLLFPFVAALAVVALPAAQTGQQPPPPPQQPAQQPVFRGGVDSVSVDVIVTSDDGEPVLDLTPEDFQVREDGEVQTIDTFKLVRAGEAEGPTRASSRQILSVQDHMTEVARAENRLFVIFLDDYHVRRINALRVREQLAGFVSQLQPYDLVAIMYPLTPVSAMTFSRNHDGTATSLLRFEGRKYDYTPLNAYEEYLRYQPVQVIERERNRMSMATLEAVCAYLGGLREGRKTVLFVSEGFAGTLPPGVRSLGLLNPSNLMGSGQGSGIDDRLAMINASDLQTQLRYVYLAASRANTSIYTLDPRGLAASEFDVADNVSYEDDHRVLLESTDSLMQLADETEGRAIVRSNDPFPLLDQMLVDTSAYYLLSYTSTEAPRDGRFHEIDVRVNRRDVDVRARKGYWAFTEEDVERALAPPDPGPADDVKAAMNALISVADSENRRRVTTWLGTRRGPGIEAVVTLAWEANTSSRDEEFDTVADVSAVVSAQNGDELFRGSVPRDASAQRPSGLVTFDAPPGPMRVRLTVTNSKDVRIDSEEIVLDVPDFTGTDVRLSTPVIFRGRTSRDLQRIREADQPVPTAGRIFSRTERLLVRFDAYGPGGTTPDVTLALLNQSGDPLVDLPAPTVLDGQTFETVLGLGSLPPGDYLVAISATAGDETVRHLLPIRISR